jgi:hypothetical protein
MEKNAKLEEKYAEKTKANNQAFQDGYKKTTESIGKAGTALTGAGMACGMLGGAFRSIGMDGVAEGFEKVGTVLTTVGGILSVVSTVMGFLGKMTYTTKKETTELATSQVTAATAEGV